ncbi:MAG: hypothetical protein WC464_04805 [Bdellovibrionales bacterium]
MNNLSLFSRSLLIVMLFCVGFSENVFARDAAFLNPGVTGMGVGDEAVKVDPKAEIDVGDTPINISKKATIFFVNQTSMPVKIEKISLSSDSLVTAEETANDCTKQGDIAPLSRCSVEVSVVPTGAGTWSVNVLMTHNGAGRIARARLVGRTAVASASEGKGTGLDISAKDIKPIDFGEVTVGDGKTVRSTLMVNNSVDPIKIYAIDVIEADNGLQRLKQGCEVDMELAPGGSCPVTLLWEPNEESQISTDLIIRHSGKLGFAVIPIRGVARGNSSKSSRSTGSYSSSERLTKSSVPLPLSARDLEKEVAKSIAPVSSRSLSGGNSVSGGASKDFGEQMSLIGTIGTRALIYLPDGNIMALSVGEGFESEEGVVKLVSVDTHSADIMVGGKKRTLKLRVASSLVWEATAQQKQDEASQKKPLLLPAGIR